MVGRSEIQPILTGARQTIEAAVTDLMQKTLDHYRSGIQITQVQMQKVDVPVQVIDSNRDVQAARIDQDRAQNEAETYANRVVPEARGRAAQVLQSAQAYREQTVAEAKGQTSRFNQVYDEYKKAPERDPRAALPGNHGTGVRRHRQNHPGFVRPGRQWRRALPAASRTAQPALDRLRGNVAAHGRKPMKLNVFGGVVGVILAAALLVAYMSLFTVFQTRQALVVRLGDPIRTITEPGLHAKWPLIDTVIYVDNRILDLENAAQEVIASDQKRLVVDAFARYRIRNPLLFYQTVSTIEGANSRLSTLLNATLRRVLGAATLTHVVRDERAALMATDARAA